ncbi:hypothetical protein [Aeromicrobium sp. UC242_57]|uniref:hypothetical protein n=1 Tax=Aeromicrobium sp. UC242_57 TaxID=3374624 RepID=UPI0037AC78AD
MTTWAFLGLGLVGGLAWLWLASPAQWEARSNGLVLTEAGAQGQFSVIVTFVIVGAIGSLLLGAVAGRSCSGLGWAVTPFVVVLALVAAVIAWRVGVELGPPDPSSVSVSAVGDKVPAQLAIDTVVPFLVWPIAALLGVVLAISADRREI